MKVILLVSFLAFTNCAEILQFSDGCALDLDLKPIESQFLRQLSVCLRFQIRFQVSTELLKIGQSHSILLDDFDHNLGKILIF